MKRLDKFSVTQNNFAIAKTPLITQPSDWIVGFTWFPDSYPKLKWVDSYPQKWEQGSEVRIENIIWEWTLSRCENDWQPVKQKSKERLRELYQMHHKIRKHHENFK